MIASQYLFLKKYTLLIMDCVIINSAFLVGYLYNYAHSKSVFADKGVLLYLAVFNLLWLIIAQLLKLYSTVALKSVESILRRTWRVAALHLTLVYLLPFVAGAYFFSFNLRSLEVCYAVLAAELISSRFFITYIVEFIIKKGKFRTKTAIIGMNEKAEQLAAYFNSTKSTYSFQGYFSDGDRHHEYFAAERSGGRVSILGSLDECIDYAVAEGISEIYSTLLPGEHTHVNEILEKAERNCVRIKFIANDQAQTAGGDFYTRQYIDGLQIITHRQEPLEDVTNKVKKRIFDIIVSFFAIIFLLSWLVLLVGLLIKLESRGPVFFVQKRSGRNNRIFWCIKFRSMRKGDPNDARQAAKQDSRITRVGAFIRKTSIDELPQFLNVLMGSMSIIGPRPHMLAHTEKYSREINSFMVRHLLKPGISGWAQVNGLRGETKDPLLMQKRVDYDLWYMENWSLMLDVKIVFMTVINIFKGEETAY